MDIRIETNPTDRNSHTAEVAVYYRHRGRTRRKVIHTTEPHGRPGQAERAACAWQWSREGQTRLRLIPAICNTVPTPA